MILVIDNYDSFTYNLVQCLGTMSPDIQVFRNDAISVDGVRARHPDYIVISPGPCTPNEAGVSMDVIRALGATVPILGVCLGHQSIGQVYGGSIVRAPHVMHGKTSPIIHDDSALFAGLDNPFDATRYHSLVIAPETLPGVLRVTARTPDHVIMAVKHREHPVEGVQFHPESILTAAGPQLLRNFLHAYDGVARRSAA